MVDLNRSPELWSDKRNETFLSNFGTGLKEKNFYKLILKLSHLLRGDAIQSFLSSNFSSDSNLHQWSGTVLAILVREMSFKGLFLLLDLVTILFSGVRPFSNFGIGQWEEFLNEIILKSLHGLGLVNFLIILALVAIVFSEVELFK